MQKTELPSYSMGVEEVLWNRCGLVCLPPRLDGYLKWHMSSAIHLGQSESQTQFIVRTPESLKNNEIVIYAGPDEKVGVLGKYTMDRWARRRPFTVHSPKYGDLEVDVNTKGTFKRSKTFSFTTDKGEHFEWRSTSGKEVKELYGKFSYGHKLVRLPTKNTELGGKRSERAEGYTSSGEEVVAILGFHVSLTSNQIFTLKFLNSGLTETFGPLWEVSTLASAFNLVYYELVQILPSYTGSA